MPAPGARGHTLVGEIQGTGLVAALQLCEDKISRKRFANETDITWRCHTIGFEEGLIIRVTGGRMIMAPALVTTRTDLDELVSKTKLAMELGLL